jgi:hypothetical protein
MFPFGTKKASIVHTYIAWDLVINLETFSTLIDFQKKCNGKYTPKAVFVEYIQFIE